MSGPSAAQMIPLVAGPPARGTLADGLSPVDGSPASDTHSASSPLAGLDLLAGVVPPTSAEDARPVDQSPAPRLIPVGRNRRQMLREARRGEGGWT